jgi:phosphoribosyl-ATP pyrophosphohydrolase
MTILDQLTSVLEQRKDADPETSYVASLHAAGLNKILEKIGEEATEVLIAAKDADLEANQKNALVSEVADLWFHTLVLLSHLELSAADVLTELDNRFGLSGIDEKADR